jgi:DNA (cytosine-5)-methyltransferase 1
MPEVYEFFAGGGMARLGLGSGWTTRFANDIDPRKAAAYRDNFGDEALRVGDIGALGTADLPGRADLAWASFPCQDLSLAGAGAGLDGARSGAIRPFFELMRGLKAQGRAPRLIALENVCGALTARGGRDVQALWWAFAELGYAFGTLVIDAALFLPQSRPRLFLVGVETDAALDPALVSPKPLMPFHTPALCKAVASAPAALRAAHLWWRLPPPPRRPRRFADILEAEPQGVSWRTPEQTARLLSLMSPLHLAKLAAAQRAEGVQVGAVYRRTRQDADGFRRQRAEVRFDETAGCLRTPAGGSSRQTLLVVEGERVRSRLVSARETARLMGLPDSYRLPAGYSDAYHLTGDGVAVDVVRHLARRLLEPLLESASARRAA